MSTGIGARQRAILAALASLDGGGRPAYHALAALTDGMTTSQAESVRQSVWSLERRGLVKISRRTVGIRTQMFIRLEVTPPEPE